jgi:hypothetical protein
VLCTGQGAAQSAQYRAQRRTTASPETYSIQQTLPGYKVTRLPGYHTSNWWATRLQDYRATGLQGKAQSVVLSTEYRVKYCSAKDALRATAPPQAGYQARKHF